MPGNRQIYDQAMNMGHSAAWDQEWDKAIAAYGRAVQEMPDDPSAHNSLGLALLQARRLEDALKVYTRAHQLAQDDPVPLEKCADVLERLNRKKEAAQQYVKVAEIYFAQRDLDKAINNWEHAAGLATMIPVHQRLALAYERSGQRTPAIREYLTLAYHLQRANRPDLARQGVERALRLEANNAPALNSLQALESGALIPDEVLASFTRPKTARAARDLDPSFDKNIRKGDKRDVGQADPRGPIGEAVETALEALADFVFSSGDLDKGGMSAIKAIEFQRQEMLTEAADAYNTAIKAGLGHASVYINLGYLHLQQQNWADAISNLQVASADPKFAAGAAHGLSQAFIARGKSRMAANHIVQTLRLIDVALAESPEEVHQLDDTYDSLVGAINEAPEEKTALMSTRFLAMLTGPEWKQRVTKTRRQLEEAITLQTEEDGSLIDIALYINDNVTQGLNLIERYQRQGLYWLAMDQAHFMLETTPDYLPIHQRIAQIMLERDNVPGAMAKYNLIAATYQVRGDNERAAGILHDALKLAPMDTDLHKSLINLLGEQGDNEAMLDEYIDLADAYYQLADLEYARDTYQKAIKLAQQNNSPVERVIHIMHRLGDIEVSRLELKQALRTYEQIRKMAPDDELARRLLVDLNYRLNDAVSAISELDGLLRVYAKTGQAKRIIQVLEELVTRYPKDMALRSRLSAVYRQTGNTPKSVEQLDVLADLQLQNGRHDDAMQTVQRIIALNPPRVDDYKKLLAQLSGGPAR